jgi:hypothetical protein
MVPHINIFGAGEGTNIMHELLLSKYLLAVFRYATVMLRYLFKLQRQVSTK